ncbi:MAG: terpene cyclase/mutase family protein [Anaerolineales bacterium]|nr:MAG: terpene cyclase/mutase family protein [Anaerolineales bacterium]
MKNSSLLTNLAILSKEMKGVATILGTVTSGVVLVLIAVVGLVALPADEARADDPNEGHVVVVLPGEQAVVRSILFSGQISRTAALQLTDLDVVAIGDSVCAIEGVGCPAATDIASCFCSDNWWSGAEWISATETWDTITWPPPLITDSSIVGFRWSKAAWGPPLFPGAAYSAAADALAWLRGQQSPTDGGYGLPGTTADVLMAVGANGSDPAEWRQPDSPSLVHYVLNKGTTYSKSGAGASGKLAVGLAATEACLPLGTLTPTDYYSPATGAFGPGSGFQAWATLGTRALSQTVPTTATQYLLSLAQPDGGWEWQSGFGSDTNSTALAIQALVAGGELVSSTAIVSGLSYLKSAQNSDGGFAYDAFGQSDTNSTAYAVQALLAAGENPLTSPWAISSSNPISFLVGMQLPDGSFEWQQGFGSNLFATVQAIPAVLGRANPVDTGLLSRCESAYLPVVVKGP